MRSGLFDLTPSQLVELKRHTKEALVDYLGEELAQLISVNVIDNTEQGMRVTSMSLKINVTVNTGYEALLLMPFGEQIKMHADLAALFKRQLLDDAMRTSPTLLELAEAQMRVASK